MKMLKKNKAARALVLVALWALPWLATSEVASSEGSMRVAREGELPAGYFAMASGYLPGDSISVTVESTGSSLQVLNVGSLDEGEGLMMLLSKEAAAVLGITGPVTAKVQLSNRAGYFDETALGYCTVKDSFAAPSKALGSAVASSDAVSAGAAPEPTEEKVSVVSDEAKPVAPVVADTPVVVMAPEPERPVESELVLVEAPGPLEPTAVASSPKTPAVKEEIVPREELVVLTPPANETSTPSAPVYEKVEVEELAATTSAKPAPKAPVEELVLVEVPRVASVPKEEPVAVFDESSAPVIPAPEVASSPKEELFVPEALAEIDIGETAELEEDFSEVEVVYDDSEPLLALAAPKSEPVESEPAHEEVTSATEPQVEEGAYSPIVLVPASSSRPPVSSKPKTASPAAVNPTPAPEPALEITPTPVAAEPVTPAPVAASEPVTTPAVGVAAEAASRVVADESALQKDCYYIQIATLGSQKNIDSTLQKYAKYPIVLVPASNPALHKVLVGPLSVDEYGAVLTKFKDAGYKDAFVKKR